jgi:hypothetical protein
MPYSYLSLNLDVNGYIKRIKSMIIRKVIQLLVVDPILVDATTISSAILH